MKLVESEQFSGPVVSPFEYSTLPYEAGRFLARQECDPFIPGMIGVGSRSWSRLFTGQDRPMWNLFSELRMELRKRLETPE